MNDEVAENRIARPGKITHWLCTMSWPTVPHISGYSTSKVAYLAKQEKNLYLHHSVHFLKKEWGDTERESMNGGATNKVSH